MFIIQKRTSEKDYPCSLIRMHLIATSKDSIFQKEDFGWGLLFNVGGLFLKTPKTRLFTLPTWGSLLKSGVAIKQIW